MYVSISYQPIVLTSEVKRKGYWENPMRVVLPRPILTTSNYIHILFFLDSMKKLMGKLHTSSRNKYNTMSNKFVDWRSIIPWNFEAWEMAAALEIELKGKIAPAVHKTMRWPKENPTIKWRYKKNDVEKWLRQRIT